jgi:hypothetical protein
MRRLLILLAATALAAAVRTAIARRRTPEPVVAPRPEPPPAAPREEPPPPPASEEPPAPAAPEEPVSRLSPAAETVKAVADDLLSEPAELPDDRTVEREVEAQLAASPLAAQAEVSVEVREHVASLEGSVPDPETATLIGDEAAHVDGVQGLDNRLRPEREAAADPDDATRGEAAGESRD